MVIDFILGTLLGFGICVVLLLIMIFIGLSDWMNSGSH